MAKRKSGGQREEFTGADLFTALSDNLIAPVLESYVDERGGDSTRMPTYLDRERRLEAQQAEDEQRRKLELENLEAQNKRRLERRTQKNKLQEIQVQTAADIQKEAASKMTDVAIEEYNRKKLEYDALRAKGRSPEQLSAMGFEEPQLNMSMLGQISSVPRNSLTPRGQSRLDRVEKAARQADNIRDPDEKSRVNVALSEELEDIQRKEVAQVPDVESESQTRISPLGENGAYRVLQPNGRLEIQHDNNLPKVEAAQGSMPATRPFGFIATPPSDAATERDLRAFTTPRFVGEDSSVPSRSKGPELARAAAGIREKGKASPQEQQALADYEAAGELAEQNRNIIEQVSKYPIYEQSYEGEKLDNYFARQSPQVLQARRSSIIKRYEDKGTSVSSTFVEAMLRTEMEQEYAMQQYQMLSQVPTLLEYYNEIQNDQDALDALRSNAEELVINNRKKTRLTPEFLQQATDDEGNPRVDEEGNPVIENTTGIMSYEQVMDPYTEEEIKDAMFDILRKKQDFDRQLREDAIRSKAEDRKSYHEKIAASDPQYAAAIAGYDDVTGSPIFKDLVTPQPLSKEAQTNLLSGLLKSNIEGRVDKDGRVRVGANVKSTRSASSMEPVNMTESGPLAKRYAESPENLSYANQKYNAIAFPTTAGFSDNISAYKKARKDAGLDDFTTSNYESESVASEIDDMLVMSLYDESNPNKDEAFQNALSLSLESMSKAISEGRNDHISMLPDNIKRGASDIHWLTGNDQEDMDWIDSQIEQGNAGEYYFTQDGFLKQIVNPPKETERMGPKTMEEVKRLSKEVGKTGNTDNSGWGYNSGGGGQRETSWMDYDGSVF